MPVCDECLAQAACTEQAGYACARCRAPFFDERSLNAAGVCAACDVETPGFDAAWNYGQYDGVLRRLIHVYKYERVETLADALGRLMLDAFPRNGERFDAIVPMPMHWWKRWTRGFNQAEALARRVAKGTGIPCVDALRRVKASDAQAGLTFAARLENVRGAFDVRGGEKKRWKGAHLLLVDDVLTTGATTSAAARVLKRKGGAERVSILTLARADRRYAWRSTAEASGNSKAKGAGQS